MRIGKEAPEGLRTISTARSIEAMNAGVKAGLRPLVQQVKPRPEIRSKMKLFQDKRTGEVVASGDFRSNGSMIIGGRSEEMQELTDWVWYYPHHQDLPFAAYLLPADLEIGERVWLEDVIEDLISGRWNQGDTYRLRHCEAIWNGEKFELQFSADRDLRIMIG
jgi:hypothetical protein